MIIHIEGGREREGETEKSMGSCSTWFGTGFALFRSNVRWAGKGECKSVYVCIYV